jgi:hypothetical protein
VSYATQADVESRFRTLTDAEAATIDAILDDVELDILARIPDLAAQVTAETIAEATVIKVEAWAAIRYLKNPSGKSQESIAGEYAYTRDSAVSSGALYISDDEWRQLLPTRAWRTRSVRLVAYGESD